MSATKKLFFNGNFVTNYESTGDDRKDLELTRSILREKGLYQEINRERAMFNHAYAFATTSSYLYSKDLAVVPRNGVSAVPFIVNSAFAIELYLKTLGQLHNAPSRGHDLLDLFDKLPESARAAIEKHFSLGKWQCGITTLEEYRKGLQELRGAFVEWRYLYESQDANEIKFQPMIFTMEVLHETCRTALGIRTA
jgi:hypothetical protein